MDNLCLTCVLLFSLINLSDSLLSSEVKWTNEMILETGFKIKWDSEDPDFLTMEMSAPTTGYLGVGFSPRGDMIESDIVIAWVDSEGIPHLKDFHGVGKSDPIEDPQQDYFLIAAIERDNETIVRFHRRWETCDEQHDISIGTDTVKLIWAWHDDDPFITSSSTSSSISTTEESSDDDEGIISEAVLSFQWHGVTTRGTRNVFMRSPSQPFPFPDGQDGQSQPVPETRINFWDLTVDNVDVDGSKNSLYMCKFFKFPKLNPMRNYHMIGFRPTITEENEGNIHRISVYQCHIPVSIVDTDKSTNKHINVGTTTECFIQSSPAEEDTESESEIAEEEIEDESAMRRSSSYSTASSQMSEYCQEYILSWALGSEGEMLPMHVGILLADQDPGVYPPISYYYKLEVHYDNLSGKQFLDSSGVRIFYTDDARMFNGGLLSVGHRVSPFLSLPPSQESFKIYSICASDCTGNGIPDGGLNVFSLMLHSHELGRKIRLRHVRNGQELQPIAEDGNYTYKYQQHRILKNEVRIFPGDQLILECDYNTMNRDKFTFGGYTAEQEMCQALLSYYPRANLTICESKPEFQSFFSSFGIKSVMGDGLMRMDKRPSFEGSDLLPPEFALERMIPHLDDEDKMISPFETIVVDKPMTLFNMSVADRMNTFDWKERRVAKNLENSLKNGRYFMYCEGTSRIPYNKYVREIPKFQKYKKISNSICRRSRFNRNSGDKTVDGSTIIATALFIKVIFDIRNYFVY